MLMRNQKKLPQRHIKERPKESQSDMITQRLELEKAMTM